MIGIIGGSGISALLKSRKFSECKTNTPYGTVYLYSGKIDKMDCVFVLRHGKNHQLPPHKVNYHANIWALKQHGITEAIAIYAVGIISKFTPGDLVVAEDFIGFNAPITFFDDFKNGIKHTDFSEPYPKEMQTKLFRAAENAAIPLKKNGIIATTHGPRFETRAEIKALKIIGANLVSMTNAYEATLFRELEIPVAGLCIATNYASGISRTGTNCTNKTKKLSHKEVIDMVAKKEHEVNRIINEFVKLKKL
ncbi:MAG: MTAP family purine nucleoside phosphorylase [Candidatus Micrarchaeota archaeon]